MTGIKSDLETCGRLKNALLCCLIVIFEQESAIFIRIDRKVQVLEHS